MISIIKYNFVYGVQAMKNQRNVPERNMPLYINKKLDVPLTIEKVLSFSSLIMLPEYNDTGEKHDFWEMVYVDCGEGTAIADERPYSISSGDVYFHKPGEVHSFHSKKDKMTHVYFIAFYSSDKFMKNFENLKISLASSQIQMIHKIIEEVKNIYEYIQKNDNFSFSITSFLPTTSPAQQQIFKNHLENLLLSIGVKLEEQNRTDTNTNKNSKAQIAMKITEIISKNIYANMTIEDISDELGYGRTYISNTFKNTYGTSIMYHYNRLKIKEAKRLIRDTNYSLITIAEMLKFNNQYYFSKVFKRYENMTPSEFKHKITTKHIINTK